MFVLVFGISDLGIVRTATQTAWVADETNYIGCYYKFYDSTKLVNLIHEASGELE
jgi:hypothetical protein